MPSLNELLTKTPVVIIVNPMAVEMEDFIARRRVHKHPLQGVPIVRLRKPFWFEEEWTERPIQLVMLEGTENMTRKEFLKYVKELGVCEQQEA